MNIRNLCPAFLFPVLQRTRHIKSIIRFSYYKKRFPMEPNRVLLFSVSRESLSGNLLYIYNEIKDRDFRISIVLEKDGTTQAELLKKIAISQYIIIDDYTQMIYPLRMRRSAKLIQVWHSTGAFKRMGFSRMGKKGSTIKTSLTHRNYTDVIVSSEGVVKNFEEAFGVDRRCIHPIGVPRTDVFFDPEYIAHEKEVLCGLYPEIQGKKLVMFAPTFRGETRDDAYYPKEYFHMEQLADQLGDEYVLGIKLHPFIKELDKISEEYRTRVIDFSEYREINDLLLITDILITDYSSVIFEYAFLKKPIVFYIPDLKQYITDRDFFYEYSDYVYGPVAYSEKELVQAIKKEAFDKQKLQGFYDRFLSACDGRSSSRFVKLILNNGKEEETCL